MEIFVAHVDPDNGDAQFFVSQTEEGLTFQLAEYFIEYWDECEVEGPIPEVSVDPEVNEQIISTFLEGAYEWFIDRGVAELDG